MQTAFNASSATDISRVVTSSSDVEVAGTSLLNKSVMYITPGKAALERAASPVVMDNDVYTSSNSITIGPTA